MLAVASKFNDGIFERPRDRLPLDRITSFDEHVMVCPGATKEPVNPFEPRENKWFSAKTMKAERGKPSAINSSENAISLQKLNIGSG